MRKKDLPVLHENMLLEAKAILAIGVDGSMVILQVDSSNPLLVNDSSLSSHELSDILYINQDGQPDGPGLYEFKGYSAFELLNDEVSRVIHRGYCTKIAGWS